MKVIGVTGGMGAGKSEVLRIMEQDFGARVILADEVGRRLMEPGGATYEKILSEFGREFAGADGKIDRQKLAREIFGDEEKRRKINSIVHPLVRQEIEEEIIRRYMCCMDEEPESTEQGTASRSGGMLQSQMNETVTKVRQALRTED